MKSLQTHKFRFDKCREEIDELKLLLQSKKDLKERDEILPFFKARRHLSSFIASFIPYTGSFDRVAHELSVFGDFTSDLVAGDYSRKKYCLVEFEDAKRGSIFRKVPGKSSREWASRFEHGFSQLVDWFWKLNSMENNPEFEKMFGSRDPSFIGMLVIGRRETMDLVEQLRLRWREEKVLIDSNKIICLTYDDLCDALDERLTTYSQLFSPED